MPATGLRTCMPDMLAALIEYLDDLRFQDGELLAHSCQRIA